MNPHVTESHTRNVTSLAVSHVKVIMKVIMGLQCIIRLFILWT